MEDGGLTELSLYETYMPYMVYIFANCVALMSC